MLAEEQATDTVGICDDVSGGWPVRHKRVRTSFDIRHLEGRAVATH